MSLVRSRVARLADQAILTRSWAPFKLPAAASCHQELGVAAHSSLCMSRMRREPSLWCRVPGLSIDANCQGRSGPRSYLGPDWWLLHQGPPDCWQDERGPRLFLRPAACQDTRPLNHLLLRVVGFCAQSGAEASGSASMRCVQVPRPSWSRTVGMRCAQPTCPS